MSLENKDSILVNKTCDIHTEPSESDNLVDGEIATPSISKSKGYIWQSGCIEFDSRVLSFLAQIIISFSVIAFCMGQLIRLPSCHSQHAYTGILTLVIGVWIDAPRFGKKPAASDRIDTLSIRKNHIWHACGIEFDSRALFFFTQLTVSVTVITFCIAQLVRLPDCSSQQTYIGILTLVIGVWIDAPRFGQK